MATAAVFPPLISISQLHPGLDAAATSVTGIVTLVWPYASSTQSSSLLLVESDFRLRRHRGQVRIHFDGASAKAVAKLGVSSGDHITISLKGASWGKDASAASTPGKGIEWDLRYRNRVFLQVRRGSEEPTHIDLDDPLPSPEQAAQEPTPRRSPYNSHIPIATRRSILATDAWQSPAFLKRRSHFSTIEHDPFSEFEDGFPDNDRRKRAKFGRRSDQWTFTDRTPSPDKEPEDETFELSSPSKKQVNGRLFSQGRDEQEEIVSETAVEAAHGGNDQGQQPKEIIIDTEDHTVHTVAPTSPATIPPPLVTENNKETTPTRSATPESPQPIDLTSASSEDDVRSGSESEEKFETDSNDGAIFSGPASDLGLDGAAFSRPKVTSKVLSFSEPPAEVPEENPIDDEAKFVSELHSDIPHKEHPRGTDRAIEEWRSTVEDSVPEQKQQDYHEPLLPTDTSTHGHDVPPHAIVPGPSPENPTQRQDDVDTIAEIPNTFDYEDTPSDSPRDTAMKDETGAISDEQPSDQQLQPAQIPEMVSNGEQPSVTSMLGAESRVEIIDLESEDEVEPQRPSFSPLSSPHETAVPIDVRNPDESEDKVEPDQVSCSPSPTHETLLPTNVHDISEFDDKPGTPIVPAATIEEKTFIWDAKALSASSFEDLKESYSRSESSTVTSLPEKSLASPKLDAAVLSAEDSKSESRSSKASPMQKMGADLKPEVVASESFVELPSTVEDSAKAEILESHLLTPDTTQPTSFVSQHSSISLQSAQELDTLPTPRLTQGRSTDIIVPIEHRLCPDVSMEAVAPSTSEKAITVGYQDPDASKEVVAPSQLEKAITVEDQEFNEGKITPSKPPTLIDKLRAMRRLSSQTPQRLGDATAVSPWFAPKRSSQVVADSEGDSDGESVSEGEQKTPMLNIIEKLRTPEKQKTLAASFIRSPPQRETIPSITSSPGYLPPSQPPPPGFRTRLSYFVPLATLQSHFTSSVDILAIALVATSVTRAASGPRDYNQSIYITDPSSSDLAMPITTVHIFRSSNKCFPIVEAGDALLLRDFKVQSFHRQLSLLSTTSSAWAVFRPDADVQVRGPPIEFGAEERGFARGLWRWWAGVSQEVRASLHERIPKVKETNPKPGFKKASTIKKEGPKPVGKVKKESIEGLGVNLPGSQSSQGKIRKGPLKERSVELDGVMESTEPPKRVLRPRGARGIPERSESPTKAFNRRSGTVFTGGLGEPEV